jgi:hypothetical protein
MSIKTVKVSAEHHQKLKVQGAELGMPLQQHQAFLLELTFSAIPELVAARESYFKRVGPLIPAMIEKAKNLTSTK